MSNSVQPAWMDVHIAPRNTIKPLMPQSIGTQRYFAKHKGFYSVPNVNNYFRVNYSGSGGNWNQPVSY